MVSHARRKAVDPSHAERYRRVGAALMESAHVMAELASESDSFGNAIAVIGVHACIAYNDALCIAWKGFKSTGDHTRAPDALIHALSHHASPERVRQFRAVVDKKDHVSYQGSYYRVDDALRLLKDAAAFCEWAEQMFDRRPPVR